MIDSGPPADPAAAVLYAADQNAQIGWDHIIRLEDARHDAEASLCLAESALSTRFDLLLFQRRLRILMDLGRDAELRSAIKGLAADRKNAPGGVARRFSIYVPDYLGVGRELEAGELILLLRELDSSATAFLEPMRRAVVLQIRRRYPDGTPQRQQRERWISDHAIEIPWVTSPPRRRKMHGH